MRLAIAIIFALTTVPAFAGDCRYGSFGGRSTVSCTGGYFESSRGGRVRSYGFRNGGFERYPGSHLPGYANERRR
ncbi:hypothetical protein [Methylocystis sp.]|uniref:hypothetical protein n=1 Tax=Methylocystis sp. TaxID=1911079 RepID=UPI003DA233AD